MLRILFKNNKIMYFLMENVHSIGDVGKYTDNAVDSGAVQKNKIKVKVDTSHPHAKYSSSMP